MRAQPLPLWSELGEDRSRQDPALPTPQYGEVFTRRWVVDAILDLVGYTPDRELASLRIVEPACGSGAFLGPMVERLSEACNRHGQSLREASHAIEAIDLQAQNVDASRQLAVNVLVVDGWSEREATAVAHEWIAQADYLLSSREDRIVDIVVGNPPYIRLEDVPDDVMSAYRRACPTMVGRSDIYIGFFEVALNSLKADGVLGFICADRWMRNQYGKHLRRLISEHYSVDMTITMHDVDAFEEPVSAYPAISILRRAPQGQSVVADATRSFRPEDAREVVAWTRDPAARPVADERYAVARLPHWFSGEESWPAGSPARLVMIEELNDRFSPLEDQTTGTRIGIGVATGADEIFVTQHPTLVEPDRLLPMSMVRDTTGGVLDWSGHYLVDPWEPDGRLVDLARFPRLRHYFEAHSTALTRRDVAGRRPAQWYRTIDKVDHSLTPRPKLLFPDMKMTIHPVLDEGGYYPHHNLYFVVSDTWDLRVLGGLLMSRVAEAFVAAYAVKMRGGTLRFQAQYLRRIRVPRPEAVDPNTQALLADAFSTRNVEAATDLAIKIYGIEHHRAAL